VTDPACTGWDDVSGRQLCEQAIALANARIGWLHWPITTTEFGFGAPCPANARCAVVIPNGGWVVFHFWFGDPVMVAVSPTGTGGGLIAGDPQPLPEWLASPGP